MYLDTLDINRATSCDLGCECRIRLSFDYNFWSWSVKYFVHSYSILLTTFCLRLDLDKLVLLEMMILEACSHLLLDTSRTASRRFVNWMLKSVYPAICRCRVTLSNDTPKPEVASLHLHLFMLSFRSTNIRREATCCLLEWVTLQVAWPLRFSSLPQVASICPWHSFNSLWLFNT